LEARSTIKGAPGIRKSNPRCPPLRGAAFHPRADALWERTSSADYLSKATETWLADAIRSDALLRRRGRPDA